MAFVTKPTKTDRFSDNFQGGRGVIFNPKIYIADLGPLNRWLFEHETEEKKLKNDFKKMRGGGVKGHLKLFQKIISFGVFIRPLVRMKREKLTDRCKKRSLV